jgi:predicted transposase/invertase (TIGR01784 family)
MSVEELSLQYKKQEYIAVQKSSIDLAIKKGLEKGREEGIEQNNINITSSMKQKGFDAETIQTITGLSMTQIHSFIHYNEMSRNFSYPIVRGVNFLK